MSQQTATATVNQSMTLFAPVAPAAPNQPLTDVIRIRATQVCNDLVRNHHLDSAIVGEVILNDILTVPSDFLQWLMDLFKQFLPLIMGCFASPVKAVSMINNPNWFQTFRLESILRGHMRNADVERKLLPSLKKSFLALGKTITQDEYVAMTMEM